MKFVIDTAQLISEIEHQPAIWDVKLAEYSDKLARRKCWEELTEIFSPAKITEREKKALNELLQKKWKNIRDRFARDSKCGGRKKSQYMYSPKLQFLQNSMRTRRRIRSDDVVPVGEKTPPTTSDSSEEESKSPPDRRTRTNKNSVVHTSKNTPFTSSGILDAPEERSKPPPEIKTRADNRLVETKLIECLERNMTELQDTAKNSQDEDRLFLLSLLTNLKSIQPNFRLKAKIEMLTVLDNYPKIYEKSDSVNTPQILEVVHSANEFEVREDSTF